MAEAPHILMPSIVDPATHRGGAGTVSRGLLHVLEQPPLSATITVLDAEPSNGLAHRWRQAAALGRSAFLGTAAKHAFGQTGSFVRRLRRALGARQPDLVIINGGDLVWLRRYLPKDVPSLLIAHNVEHRLYQSQIDHAPRWTGPFRSLLRADCARLEKQEIEGWRAMRDVVFLSPADAEYARERCPEVRQLVVPPLFHTPRAPIETKAEESRVDAPLRLAMLANFSWWPNRLGLRWFLDHVLPSVERPVEVHLIGHDSETMGRGNAQVFTHGFLPDLTAEWSNFDTMIGPVFAGGGTKVKLAEALYQGVPVLATPFAVEGLPLIADDAVVVLGTAEEWIDFLNSPAASIPKSRRVSPSLSETFAASTHQQALQMFVLDVLRRGSAQAQLAADQD